MRVLELLAFSPLSAPQVASALNAQPRTVRRVIGRLVEDGYLTYRQEGRRRLYEPTMRLVALAGQVVDGSVLARVGRPHVELLHARTGMTAHLVVPSYQSALCIAHAGPEAPDARPRLRELVPAHCTAGGKALLAHRDRWRESVLSAPLEAFTDTTTTDPALLRAELERVRSDGYAMEDSEYRLGARAAAAPVLHDGEAVAAVVVSGGAGELGGILVALTGIADRLAEALRGERP